MTATIACVFMVKICYGDGENESIVITAVQRRNNSDYYYSVSNDYDNHILCEDHETFMVEEKTCVKNEELFKGK